MLIRGSERVSENQNRESKCLKMTEEGPRIIGMNGVTNNGSPLNKEDNQDKTNNYTHGGRLKFFKDGKFILELARAREGEKCAWVPVPKKTFWPPQGSATSLSQYRQESSTSLSVSDDNSSVQSSPWQRDHTWKQTTPLRNVSNHLSFYYGSNGKFKRPKCLSYLLRRRPYAIIPQLQLKTETSSSSSLTDQQLNEQILRTKCILGIKCNRCVKSENLNKNRKISKTNLIQIVQILWNKSLPTVSNNITSPRKRILKELERVTIDDLSLKRSKSKSNQSQTSSAVNHQVSAETVIPSVIETNGNSSVGNLVSVKQEDESTSTQSQTLTQTQTSKAATTSSKNCNSYSINSLLKNDRDPVKKEQDNNKSLSSQYVTASHRTMTHHHKEPSYDTVDSHRIDVINTNSKRSPVPGAGPEYAGYHPYVPHPYMYPGVGVLGPPYMPPTSYYSAYGRSAPSYLAGGHSMPALPPHRHNGAHTNAPSPPSHIQYSPWPSHQYQPPTHTARDDNISDVPLNLSKHAD